MPLLGHSKALRYAKRFIKCLTLTFTKYSAMVILYALAYEFVIWTHLSHFLWKLYTRAQAYQTFTRATNYDKSSRRPVGAMLTNVRIVEGGIRCTGFQEMCLAVHFVLFCILVCYLISELIYHLILTILVYGLKTLFFRDLGRLWVLKELRECKGVAGSSACKELYYVYFM